MTGPDNFLEREDLSIAKKITRVILFTLLFSTFGGALRKWVINANIIGNIILFIQLILPFFFIFFLRNKKIESPFRKSRMMAFYLFLLIMLSLNPMNQTIMHGILGFLLHLNFWFFIFFYSANKKYFQLESIIPIGIALCVIELILGLVQYNLPTTHFLNQYADNEKITAIATIGDHVRITGTFSYLGGLSSFLIFQVLFLWAAIHKGFYPRICLLLLLAGFVVAIMSGSRSTAIIYIVFVGLMVFAEYFRSILIRKVSTQVLVVIGLVIASLFYLGSNIGILKDANAAWDNFNGRVQQNRASGEEQQRVIDPILKTINFKGAYPLIGVGLGSTYQGAMALFGTSKYVTEYGYIEEEWERIVLEGGFVLFIFRIFLFISLFKTLRMPVFPRVVILAIAFMFIPIVIQTYNAFFLALGLIFLDWSYTEKASNSI